MLPILFILVTLFCSIEPAKIASPLPTPAINYEHIFDKTDFSYYDEDYLDEDCKEEIEDVRLKLEVCQKSL